MVDFVGKDASNGSLTASTWPDKEVGVRNLAIFNGRLETVDDRILTNDLTE